MAFFSGTQCQGMSGEEQDLDGGQWDTGAGSSRLPYITGTTLAQLIINGNEKREGALL